MSLSNVKMFSYIVIVISYIFCFSASGQIVSDSEITTIFTEEVRTTEASVSGNEIGRTLSSINVVTEQTVSDSDIISIFIEEVTTAEAGVFQNETTLPPMFPSTFSDLITTTIQPIEEETNSLEQPKAILSCNETICVRKCCQANTFRSMGKCLPLKNDMEDWSPQIANVTLLYGIPPNPNPNASCLIHSMDEIELLSNGSALFRPRDIILSVDFYCFDNISSGNETYIQAGVCYEPILHSDFENAMKLVRRIASIISASFLLILIIAHILNPAMRTKVLEKCFLSMCTALFFAHLSLMLVQWEIINYYGKAICITIGMIVQYFNLSFNFWLHLRCYETFRVVRGTVKAIPMSTLSSSRNRLMKYSLIGWGIPLVIVIFTVIMQLIPSDLIPNIHPNMGLGRCWFIESFWVLALYYYAYQVILHILNVIYMGTSFYLLFKTGKMACCAAKVASEDKMRTYNRKNMNMFWQQFFIFLIFIGLLSLDSITLLNPRATIWQYVDVLNSIPGVYLFSIFMISNESRKNMIHAALKSTSSIASTLSTIVVPKKSWRNVDASENVESIWKNDESASKKFPGDDFSSITTQTSKV